MPPTTRATTCRPRQLQEWRRRDPLPAARQKLLELCGMSEAPVAAMERAVDEEVRSALAEAMAVGRPDPSNNRMAVFAEAPPPKVKPYRTPRVKNGEAVGRALDYLLENNPRAFLFGLDVGIYGSAFKTCKGLIERHGPQRVLDMPLCESALVGFALGASQAGGQPIFEFQFADFSTEAVTQLGLNAGTWYFRTGQPAPLLLRLPCGGGLTMGAFHSGEFEGLWSRFPGLKLLYPATAQETFEALVAGFYDPNPCLVFEHKLLYWSKSGEIDFDGNLESVWRPRRYTEGTDLTLVAFGAMVHEALAAAVRSPRSIEVWNPFVLQPMDLGPILESVCKTGRLLVVQECGAMQGLGDHVISSVCREALGRVEMPAATDRRARPAGALRAGVGVVLPAEQPAHRGGRRSDGPGGMMEATLFKMPLYLPAQGATEIEATIIEWHVAEGDRFHKGQALVQVDSAKSVFDFEAPCDGLVIRRFHLEGETLPLTEPIMEIETDDPAMRDWIPPAAAGERPLARIETGAGAAAANRRGEPIVLSGLRRLPARARGDQRGTGRRLPRNHRRVRLSGDRHPPAALGRARREALGHGLPGGVGGDPPLGHRRQGHRRRDRGHDHARRGHALDGRHLAGSAEPANHSRLRPERGLFRLALRGVGGPRA